MSGSNTHKCAIFKRYCDPDDIVHYLQVTLAELENEMSRKLIRLLQTWRENDPSYYQLCHLVRQGEQPREGYFLLANLLEDQVGGSNGYVDWILQLHRQVQQNPWQGTLISIMSNSHVEGRYFVEAYTCWCNRHATAKPRCVILTILHSSWYRKRKKEKFLVYSLFLSVFFFAYL